jgi:L-ascorbate metabolism protein UlaG (beta-lactamase superfamily)
MDWNETAKHGALEVLCLPAIHNSGRSLLDKNKTLWCSFGLRTPSATLYFSGDTAYHPEVFKAMKEVLGRCDLAMLAIGAYSPGNLLAHIHVNPEQAVQIALDIGASNVVGMHWGTLSLSDEPVAEPIQRFQHAAKQGGFLDHSIWLMKLGESRVLGGANAL